MEYYRCGITLFATTLTANIIMVLFKCGTCTFVMDSEVHGNRPCQMCGERIIKRLPLDRWDVVDAEEYNSLFPPVEDFRAAIGRPTNDVHLGDKKPPFELGTIERELLSCTCGTCVFLAERYLKKKRANDVEMAKIEADISLVELKLKMKRTAVSKENKRAPVAEDKKPSSKKRTAGAKEK